MAFTTKHTMYNGHQMFPSNIGVQKIVMWKENVSNVIILLGVLLIVQSVFAPFPKTLQDTSTAARENPEIPASIELFDSATSATSILLNCLMFCIFCI